MRTVIVFLERERHIYGTVAIDRKGEKLHGHLALTQPVTNLLPVNIKVAGVVAVNFRFRHQLFLLPTDDLSQRIGVEHTFVDKQFILAVEQTTVDLQVVVQLHHLHVTTLQQQVTHLYLTVEQQTLAQQDAIVGKGCQGIGLEGIGKSRHPPEEPLTLVFPEFVASVSGQRGECAEDDMDIASRGVHGKHLRGVSIVVAEIIHGQVGHRLRIFRMVHALCPLSYAQGLFAQTDGFGIVTRLVVVIGQVVHALCIVVVVLSQDALTDMQRLGTQTDGLGIVFEEIIIFRQVVQRLTVVGVVVATKNGVAQVQRLGADTDGLLEILRPRLITSQVRQRLRIIGVVTPEGTSAQFESHGTQTDGLLLVAEVGIIFGQIVQRLRIVGMVGAQHTSSYL